MTNAQCDRLLVRRPRPFQTESMLGYILRLSEKNGYEDPTIVFVRAGRVSRISRVGGEMAALARIAALTPAEILSIETRSVNTKRKSCQLLGQCINSANLQSQQSKVCPECVKDKGFIEAHFDLAVMIACPAHGKLVTHCTHCSAAIQWKRPGLLKCQCGAALHRSDDSSVAPAVRELLDIVRRKVLHLELGTDYSSGLPIVELWNMDLKSLIYLIGTLGRRVAMRRGAMKWNDFGKILPGAAEALANWPHGFHDWLGELTVDIPDDAPLKLSAPPLRGIYYSLSYGIRPRSFADFIRRALSAFVVNHFGTGYRGLEFRRGEASMPNDMSPFENLLRCQESLLGPL